MTKFEKAIAEIKEVLSHSEDWSDDLDNIQYIVDHIGDEEKETPPIRTDAERLAAEARLRKAIFGDNYE
jgi:hypothetical protein